MDNKTSRIKIVLMELKVAFSKVLRRLRLATGCSQESFALHAGIDRSYISRLERGQLQPTISTLFIIADTLKMPASELVKLVESERHLILNSGISKKRIKRTKG